MKKSHINNQLGRVITSFSIVSLMLGMTACSTQNPSAGELSGSGASLPAPLYDMWFFNYEQQHPQIQIDYASIGSGAGIEQFLAQEVDFASTDAPLTDTEMAQFPAERGKVIQVPVVGSAVVLAYNLEGVEGLQLSREAYCGIVAGQITRWNDPKIAANNPDISLPNQPIAFVYRQDSSGSTYIFTNHLNAACDNWSAGVGKEVNWTTPGIEAPGNEGVAATIKQTDGAIGYIGFTHAEKHFLPMASLENQAGYFIEPSPNAAEFATTLLETTRDLTAMESDPASADAYPIVGLIYMLLYENYSANATGQAIRDLIKWALVDGRSIAYDLGYAPLSQELAVRVAERLNMGTVSQIINQ